MRCGVYVRVSSDKLEQQASLQYQKELFYNYIADKGWDLYEVYIDVESGTTAKRKNLQRLIDDAMNKKIDVILAKELSRLARNGELSYQIKNLCENHGVHIITLDGAINTLQGNTHMFGLYAWMYEQEAQRTSERVKETLKTRAKKGLFKGSTPPYGYTIKDGKLHIRDDETPNIVRRIFNEYLAGYGRDSIARRLYNEGIPTPAEVAGKKNAGDKWNDSTIKLILTNPHYTGDLVQGRTTTVSVTSTKRKKASDEELIIIPNAHEPIIPRDVFEAVQHQMKLRSKTIPAPKRHLFTNIAYCADCGKGMWYRSNRKGYVCGGYARFGKKACSSHVIKEEVLKQTIIHDIHSLMQQIDKEYYLKQLEEKAKQSQLSVQKKLDKINKKIDALKARKRKYIELLADEKITQEDYQDMIEANSKEINELVVSKKELESLLSSHKVVENIQKLKQELAQFLNFDELTPEILHRLIDRIEIKADGTPKIFYRFSAPKIE